MLAVRDIFSPGLPCPCDIVRLTDLLRS